MKISEIVGVLTALVAVASSLIGIIDYLESNDDVVETDNAILMENHNNNVTVLARTTFSDNNSTYIIGFDGDIIKYNNSIVVIFIEK